MDIYSFIESKAVRKHLQDMNYQFTGKQMIVIILNSPMALRDKIEALRWVSSNMVIESDEEDRFCRRFYKNFAAEVEQLARLPELIESEGDGYFHIYGTEDEFNLGSFKDLQAYVMSLPAIERYSIQAEKSFFGEDKSGLFISFSLNADGEVFLVYKYCIDQERFPWITFLPTIDNDCKYLFKELSLPFKKNEVIVPVRSVWSLFEDMDIGTLLEKDGELMLCSIHEGGYIFDDGNDPYLFYCDYYEGKEPSDWIQNLRNGIIPEKFVKDNLSETDDIMSWYEEYNSKISYVVNAVSESN